MPVRSVIRPCGGSRSVSGSAPGPGCLGVAPAGGGTGSPTSSSMSSRSRNLRDRSARPGRRSRPLRGSRRPAPRRATAPARRLARRRAGAAAPGRRRRPAGHPGRSGPRRGCARVALPTTLAPVGGLDGQRAFQQRACGQRGVQADHGVEEVLRALGSIHGVRLVQRGDRGDPDVGRVRERVERPWRLLRRSPRLDPNRGWTGRRIGCISPVRLSASTMLGFGDSVMCGSG